MNYWEQAALQREIAIQEGSTYTVEEILKLYDEALEDIEREIRTIKRNFQKRFGIDDETAEYFLTEAQKEENLRSLIYALEYAPNERAQQAILDYIQRDGLSVRAYAARTERYVAVEGAIYARIKRLAADETARLTGRLETAYQEGYYGMLDDTAKGLDVGLNFSMLNDRAIEEAVGAKWHGKRFSERIWSNTDRLAQAAQTIVVRSLMTGTSEAKTARELAEEFEVEKYHATTLVRTETAHIHAMADKRAYEDLGIPEYKYLATLDYRTCHICGALDGMVFKVSEIREGENYPSMHPRCRCTTTMNMQYTGRSARNVFTGKSETVDGSVTYKEWRDSMSDEEKAAFELAQKKDSRRTADKARYAQYKSVLGAENMPKTLDEFQNVMYNGGEEAERLKLSYKTVGEINSKDWTDSFKDKARQAYFNFRSENIEMSSHAIARFLSRKDGAKGITYTFDDIVRQCRMPVNYVQPDGRRVKFYNSTAIIYNSDNDTVVSIVNRKKPKKDWSGVDDKTSDSDDK